MEFYEYLPVEDSLCVYSGSATYPGSAMKMGSATYPGSAMKMGSATYPGSAMKMGSTSNLILDEYDMNLVLLWNCISGYLWDILVEVVEWNPTR